jgi:Meckel syndrome type 1 protein
MHDSTQGCWWDKGGRGRTTKTLSIPPPAPCSLASIWPLLTSCPFTCPLASLADCLRLTWPPAPQVPVSLNANSREEVDRLIAAAATEGLLSFMPNANQRERGHTTSSPGVDAPPQAGGGRRTSMQGGAAAGGGGGGGRAGRGRRASMPIGGLMAPNNMPIDIEALKSAGNLVWTPPEQVKAKTAKGKQRRGSVLNLLGQMFGGGEGEGAAGPGMGPASPGGTSSRMVGAASGRQAAAGEASGRQTRPGPGKTRRGSLAMLGDMMGAVFGRGPAAAPGPEAEEEDEGWVPSSGALMVAPGRMPSTTSTRAPAAAAAAAAAATTSRPALGHAFITSGAAADAGGGVIAHPMVPTSAGDADTGGAAEGAVSSRWAPGAVPGGVLRVRDTATTSSAGGKSMGAGARMSHPGVSWAFEGPPLQQPPAAHPAAAEAGDHSSPPAAAGPRSPGHLEVNQMPSHLYGSAAAGGLSPAAAAGPATSYSNPLFGDAPGQGGAQQQEAAEEEVGQPHALVMLLAAARAQQEAAQQAYARGELSPADAMQVWGRPFPPALQEQEQGQEQGQQQEQEQYEEEAGEVGATPPRSQQPSGAGAWSQGGDPQKLPPAAAGSSGGGGAPVRAAATMELTTAAEEEEQEEEEEPVAEVPPAADPASIQAAAAAAEALLAATAAAAAAPAGPASAASPTNPGQQQQQQQQQQVASAVPQHMLRPGSAAALGAAATRTSSSLGATTAGAGAGVAPAAPASPSSRPGTAAMARRGSAAAAAAAAAAGGQRDTAAMAAAAVASMWQQVSAAAVPAVRSAAAAGGGIASLGAERAAAGALHRQQQQQLDPVAAAAGVKAPGAKASGWDAVPLTDVQQLLQALGKAPAPPPPPGAVAEPVAASGRATGSSGGAPAGSVQQPQPPKQPREGTGGQLGAYAAAVPGASPRRPQATARFRRVLEQTSVAMDLLEQTVGGPDAAPGELGAADAAGEGLVQGVEKGIAAKGMQVEARGPRSGGAGSDVIKAGMGGSKGAEAAGDSPARSRAVAGKRRG